MKRVSYTRRNRQCSWQGLGARDLLDAIGLGETAPRGGRGFDPGSRRMDNRTTTPASAAVRSWAHGQPDLVRTGECCATNHSKSATGNGGLNRKPWKAKQPCRVRN